jgi:hypothetical protein
LISLRSEARRLTGVYQIARVLAVARVDPSLIALALVLLRFPSIRWWSSTIKPSGINDGAPNNKLFIGLEAQSAVCLNHDRLWDINILDRSRALIAARVSQQEHLGWRNRQRYF